MSNGKLNRFKESLYLAVEKSGTTIDSITRPVYLATCSAHGIDGWSSDEIKSFKDGWTRLKKLACESKSLATECKPLTPTAQVPKTLTVDTIGFSKELYLHSYASYVKTHGYTPNMSTFKQWYGDRIDRDVYRNIHEIDEDYRCYYKNEAEKYLLDKKSWTDEYKESFYKQVKAYNKFVLVSVGSFCNVDFDFLKSVKRYADENHALVIGLPLFKRHKKSVSGFSADPRLRDYMWMAFEDVVLNDNLMVQVIKANCTVKSTITGLNQIVAKYNSSIIVAGINQQLKYIPVLKDKTPNMIASTGCCTELELNQSNKEISIPTKAEKLAQERIAIKGALVVELGENDTFTVRNIEAAPDKSVIDLGMVYSSSRPTYQAKDSAFIIGDLHAPQHNEVLLQANINAIKKYGCSRVVLHDSVNMAYISHHNADQAITRAQMVEEGKADVLGEVGSFVGILKQLTDIDTVKEVIIPYSNHPAHFDRFIQDISRMSKDDINLRTSLMTALAMLDNKNTLQFLVEEVLGFKSDKLRWVAEDSGVDIYGVQVGLHGSEKVNGGRMTSTSTNNAFPKTVMAHKHSASIDGDTITVGIVCEKDQGYNHGLSSWTESSAIVYFTGNVQLLTFVNVKGEYKLWL